MRKLVFTLLVLVLGIVSFSCEPEIVAPQVQEPNETLTGGGQDEESGGVRES